VPVPACNKTLDATADYYDSLRGRGAACAHTGATATSLSALHGNERLDEVQLAERFSSQKPWTRQLQPKALATSHHPCTSRQPHADAAAATRMQNARQCSQPNEWTQEQAAQVYGPRYSGYASEDGASKWPWSDFVTEPNQRLEPLTMSEFLCPGNPLIINGLAAAGQQPIFNTLGGLHNASERLMRSYVGEPLSADELFDEAIIAARDAEPTNLADGDSRPAGWCMQHLAQTDRTRGPPSFGDSHLRSHAARLEKRSLTQREGFPIS
jgi:hypothetical protein